MRSGRIENLPFTTYDLISYLTPGIIVLFILLIHPSISDQIYGLIYIGDSFTEQAISATFAFGLSYTIGVILSFVSSIITENFVKKIIGYPTNYMFRKKGIYKRMDIINNIRFCMKMTRKYNLASVPVTIILNLPLLLPLCFFHLCFSLTFYFKPLKRQSIERAKSNLKALSGLSSISSKTFRSWFPNIDYYTQQNCVGSASKAYNYVVLYGFLRSMCTIITLYLWAWLIGHCLIELDLANSENIHTISNNFLLDYLIISSFNLLILLAYMKFYRRYSREVIMNFAALKTSSINN